MKAVDEYIKNLTKCNNQCDKYEFCLRYDIDSAHNLKIGNPCNLYFKIANKEVDFLQNLFGMK